MSAVTVGSISSLWLPSQDPSVNAVKVVELLEHGREAQRNHAERLLTDSQVPVNRTMVREKILKLLANRYKAQPQPRDDEAEKLRSANTRAWILYILPSVAEGDPIAATVMEQALDRTTEPNKWCRYWALVGQFRFSSPTLTPAKTAQVIKSDGEELVLMLARAVAARAADTESLNTLRSGLLDPTQEHQWEALRAIRIVPLEDGDIIRKLCEIVDDGAYSDITYDSIQALKKIGPDSEYVKLATRTLGNFVDRWGTYPGRDAMRLRAIAGLGGLRRSSEAGILVEQLLDENPAIVREAARALEACVGTRSTVDRILAETTKSGDETRSYAFALRWLEKRDEVVDQLAIAMVSGPTEQRKLARSLLSEVGGMAAMEKLRVQSNLMSQHSEFLKHSEDHVQALFESSIQDAHTGFKRSLIMDQFVFYVGLALIGVSATLLLIHKGELTADWVGTGATGVLGVLYTLLLAKPRQQVENAVDHLMKLKVVFLGFLRQLHQADSAYIRRLLDDKSVAPEDLKSFNSLIEEAMQKAADQLKTK